ncbi:MAG: hypothetical protein KF802_02920 [Bdellovibrionaceae bacterium]|nr:hypothetical protein [Pseudobdellovibrionaceae bacterium]
MKPLLTDKQLTLVIKEDPSESEVLTWIENLMTTWSFLYHPDDDPMRYVNRETGKSLFTHEERDLLENSTNRLFELYGNDLYKIGVKAYHNVDGKLKAKNASSMSIAVMEEHQDKLKKTDEAKKKPNH